MEVKKLIPLLAATVFLTNLFGRDPYERQEALDVLHYSFRLELNDTTDRFAGEADIIIRFRKRTTSFFLDFGGRTKGEGMSVRAIWMKARQLNYKHEGERLTVMMDEQIPAGETRSFTVWYSGTPEDGLLISQNKFGDRTFFADHWPDRGHLWLPCIDHPSEKATVEFVIIAPDHYRVVASGAKQEETALDKKRRLTRYMESVPVAMKVTAVGVARFSVKDEIVENVPQSIWVFPQNEREGFSDFAVATKIFTYFNQQVGPYAYEKLAHVQSQTRWGGLENAGNIFYNESSVTGQNKSEGLIAHEVAHQWFGDAVTENDWHHVWLSEGFATGFATFYMEHAYGQLRMTEILKDDRQKLVEYYRKNSNPVVDTTITDIGKVLNTNTSDKGGWVLQMLRIKVGDDAFWKGIREFYNRYKNKNAMTADFRVAMETASGQNLGKFFDQWIYRGGHPKLDVSWTYQGTKVPATVTIRQVQHEPAFTFPLDILFKLPNGKEVRETILVDNREKTHQIKLPGKPLSLEVDPETRLLFEGKVNRK